MSSQNVTPKSSKSLSRVVIAIAGIGLVVLGIRQMLSGVHESSDPSSQLHSELKKTGSDGPSGLKELSREGIKVKYPSSWRVSEERSGIVFGVNTGSGTINANVIQQTLNDATGTDLASYTKANLDGISAMKTPQYSFDKVVSDETTTVHGTPARKVAVEAVTQPAASTDGKAAEPVRVRQLVVVAVKDGGGYLLTFTSPASFFEDAEPVFQMMIDSWEF